MRRRTKILGPRRIALRSTSEVISLVSYREAYAEVCEPEISKKKQKRQRNEHRKAKR